MRKSPTNAFSLQDRNTHDLNPNIYFFYRKYFHLTWRIWNKIWKTNRKHFRPPPKDNLQMRNGAGSQMRRTAKCNMTWHFCAYLETNGLLRAWRHSLRLLSSRTSKCFRPTFLFSQLLKTNLFFSSPSNFLDLRRCSYVEHPYKKATSGCACFFERKDNVQITTRISKEFNLKTNFRFWIPHLKNATITTLAAANPSPWDILPRNTPK